MQGVTSVRVLAEPSDAVLVGRALDRDDFAEEALYRRHAPRVLGILTRLVGSKSEADDLLHDTFILAFRTLGRLRNAESFGSWVTGIAANHAKQFLRRQRIGRRLGILPSGQDASFDLLASPRCSPETATELAKLQATVNRMPVKVRIAWSLRYVEGFSLAEVAETISCSLATAKRRIAEGREAVEAVVSMAVIE